MYQLYDKSRINTLCAIVLGLLFFLPGCHKPFRVQANKFLPIPTELRTQLHDVTLPIDCRIASEYAPVRVAGVPGSVRQRFITHATRDQLVQLYAGEMPYNGWHFFGQFGDQLRTVLVYEKMHKQLIVIIEPTAYDTQLDVMLMHKRDELI
ncbi:MAG: hypothetical protein WCE21_04545 [Candidatus Babeliales bacterium]